MVDKSKEYEEAMRDTFQGGCKELQEAVDQLRECFLGELQRATDDLGIWRRVKRFFKYILESIK